jgi:hypothetical protein
MAVFSTLHEDLATANRHIAKGQAQIAQQAKLVRELAADGHDGNESAAPAERQPAHDQLAVGVQ